MRPNQLKRAEVKGFANLRRRVALFLGVISVFALGIVSLGLAGNAFGERAVGFIVYLVLFPAGFYGFYLHLQLTGTRCPRCAERCYSKGVLRNSFAMRCMHCGVRLYWGASQLEAKQAEGPGEGSPE